MKVNITLKTVDGTAQVVAFAANATTAIRFRNLFHQDLLSSITSMLSTLTSEQLKELSNVKPGADGTVALTPEEMTPALISAMTNIISSGGTETVQQLAYIMHEQAEKADMNALSEESYLEWLDHFDTFTFMENAMEFIHLYTGQKNTTSELKKKQDQLTGM